MMGFSGRANRPRDFPSGLGFVCQFLRCCQTTASATCRESQRSDAYLAPASLGPGRRRGEGEPRAGWPVSRILSSEVVVGERVDHAQQFLNGGDSVDSFKSELFEIGEIVMLKSGGPPMTVIRFADKDRFPQSCHYGPLVCCWFSGETLNHETFDRACLVRPVEASEEGEP